MAAKFKALGAIHLDRQTTIMPGKIVTEEALRGAANVKEFLASKFIVRVGGEDDYQPEQALAVNADGKLAEAPPAPPVPAPEPEEAPPPPPAPAVGLWNLDPAKLEGKPLQALNAMLLERDASAKPYKKAGDAIKHLSQDFQG